MNWGQKKLKQDHGDKKSNIYKSGDGKKAVSGWGLLGLLGKAKSTRQPVYRAALLLKAVQTTVLPN